MFAAAPASTATPPRAPTTPSSFSSAVAERAVVVGAGHRQQGLARSEQRDALARCEPQRAFEVLGEPDGHGAVVADPHVDEPIGGVGRQSAEWEELEVAFQIALADLEAKCELGQRRPRVLEIHGTRARTRRRRSPASGRGLTTHPVRGRRPAR